MYSQNMTLSLKPTINIQAGVEVSFTIPISEKFRQPLTLDSNDTSFYISIPQSGMTSQQPVSVDRIGTSLKGFSYSEIYYGVSVTPPIPNHNMSINFVFTPNFNILAGSIVRIQLPGFQHLSGSKIFISQVGSQGATAATGGAFEYDGKFNFGLWDSTSKSADFKVRNGYFLPAAEKVNIWVEIGFKVPDSKFVNDLSLTIEVVGNQIAKRVPIMYSPAIVDRKFEISTINFSPLKPGQTTSLIVRLVATVDLPSETVVDIGLPGFTSPYLIESIRNPTTGFVPQNIFVNQGISCRLVASQIELSCEASWDWTDENLYIRIIGPSSDVLPNTRRLSNAVAIPQQTTIEIEISESAGFILPQFVDASISGGLTIAAVDNIPASAFSSSPLVGNGPYLNQTYCLDLYAFNGVLMHLNFEPAMPANLLIDPVCMVGVCSQSEWVRDPCSESELSRCACRKPTLPTPLVISGHGLTPQDTIKIVSAGEDCDSDTVFAFGVEILEPETIIAPSRIGDIVRGMQVSGQVSNDGRSVTFNGIRGIQSGQYDICYRYAPGDVSLVVGKIFVKPSCTSPLVLHGSVCYATCPSGYVPINRVCEMFIKPPLMTYLQAEPALAGTLAFVYPNADYLGLSYLSPTDSTYIFFQYIMIENLRSILFEADPTRFVVQAIGTGLDSKLAFRQPDTIIVTVVLTPSTEVSRRTSFELFTLLSHLIKDYDSILYQNEFFSTLLVERSNVDNPILVVWCPTSGKYQTVCPLGLEPVPENPIDLPPWFYVTSIVAGIVGGLVWLLVNAGLYRVDRIRKIVNRPTTRLVNVQNLFSIIEKNNDFSLIKTFREIEKPSSPPTETPPVQVSIASPPVSPNSSVAVVRNMATWEKLLKDLNELEPDDRAIFARDWLDGRWMDASVFTRARLRLRPPPGGPVDITKAVGEAGGPVRAGTSVSLGSQPRASIFGRFFEAIKRK
jgi:hypothetical protein